MNDSSANSTRIGVGACRSVSDYRKIGRIGEGTYGTVYSAVDKQTGERVALKRVLLHGETAEGFPITSLREISVLRLVDGRHHCVKLLNVSVNERRDGVFLVFEYCEHDLSTLLSHIPRAFSESEVKTLTLQLLSALQYLHSHYIIHRDIKMSNLLYNNKGELKLADFGLARSFTILRHPILIDGTSESTGDSTAGRLPERAHEGHHPRANPMTARVVTLWYRAPELLLLPAGDGSTLWSYRYIP